MTTYRKGSITNHETNVTTAVEYIAHRPRHDRQHRATYGHIQAVGGGQLGIDVLDDPNEIKTTNFTLRDDARPYAEVVINIGGGGHFAPRAVADIADSEWATFLHQVYG